MYIYIYIYMRCSFLRASLAQKGRRERGAARTQTRNSKIRSWTKNQNSELESKFGVGQKHRNSGCGQNADEETQLLTSLM